MPVGLVRRRTSTLTLLLILAARVGGGCELVGSAGARQEGPRRRQPELPLVSRRHRADASGGKAGLRRLSRWRRDRDIAERSSRQRALGPHRGRARRPAGQGSGLDPLQESDGSARVERTCGQCHASALRSPHEQLARHDRGSPLRRLHEMGLFPERGSRYSVFPQTRAAGMGGEVTSLVQLPWPSRSTCPSTSSARTTPDLARKECMQCHLWSEGRGVRGRVGFDGDYRGVGLRRVPRGVRARRPVRRAPIARRCAPSPAIRDVTR